MDEENQNSNTMKTEVREYAQDPKKYASKDEKDESSLKQKLLEYLKILIVTISTFFETMKKIFEYLIVKEQLKENFKKLYSKLEAIEPETYLPVSDEQWENYIKSVIPAPIYEEIKKILDGEIVPIRYDGVRKGGTEYE